MKNYKIITSLFLLLMIFSCEEIKFDRNNRLDKAGTNYVGFTITSPNGGESWTVGSIHNITWTTSGTVENVKLEYTTNGSTWTLITASVANNGAYAWTIPSTSSPSVKVRVTDASDAAITDVSDANFTIAGTLTVTSPNGGEDWLVASIHNISWTTSGTVANVKLEYTTNDSSWNVIATSIANTNTYEWTIPDIPSATCKVRVTDASNAVITDMGDDNFTISAATLTIMSPNGGEDWLVASNHNITWTTSGTVTNVKIEYTTNGTVWNAITASATNVGTYAWLVPNSVSTTCKVRVTDASNTTITDMSNVDFTISASTLTIVSPNGSENWTVASSHNITWTTFGMVANVKIEYTTNGTTWNMITSNTANANTYSWTIPNVASTGCKVRLTDAFNAAITDMSDADFTMAAVWDIDGNVYHTVIIGTQEWLIENLKTTRYRNGTAMQNATDNVTWAGLTTGAFCNYNNAPAPTYGRLYNWYAVNNANNIAPTGWHVPSDAEWTTLITFLGGESVAGGKLKEAGLAHWAGPNTGATNETGFTALPGGYRTDNSSTFGGIGGNCIWWSASEFSATVSIGIGVLYDRANSYPYYDTKAWGHSVRCVKD